MDDSYLQRFNPRLYKARHYLDDQDVQTRFRERLLVALRDPSFIGRRGQFDWARFAREFSAEDFDPPLTTWELFAGLQRHFWQPGQGVPRSRVWWLIRLVTDAEDPVAYLEQLKGAGAFIKLARLLNAPGITNLDISIYLSRFKFHGKPRIPDWLKVPGKAVLAINYSSVLGTCQAWGLRCYPHGRHLAWGVVFKEDAEPFSETPDPEKSPRALAEFLTQRHAFRPDVILLYTGFLYYQETGRKWWGTYWPLNQEMERLGLKVASPPIVVDEWDENGWPIVRARPNVAP